IANLHIHGTPAVIDAHIAGGLPQLFALLDMKPLQYPTRFHVNTSSSHGNASLDASFRVPTIRGESVDAIGISVKGVVSKFGIALAPHTKISDGSLQLAVDNAKLHAAGNVVIGGTPLDVDWLEIFKPNGPVSTTVNVHGVLDDAARSNLGLSLGSFLTGPIGATAHLTGYRGTVQAASIDADLTQAILSADVLAWRKPAGVPSSAHVVAQMAAGGSFRSANVAIQGTSITASANLGFGSDGGVESVSAPVVRAGAGNDFAVTMKKRLDGGEDFAITGHSLDASGLLKRKSGAGPTRPATAQSPEPFHLTAYLDKVVLHDDAALSPFSLDMTGVGQHPRTFSVKAGLTKTASLSVNMTASNGQRHLTANAEDAGTLVRTLLNYQSLKGGELSLDATAPMTSPESQKSADYSGELVIRNATLLNQPFIARLFSSGSPGGLVDLMQGQGIVLDRVHIPFRLNDDVITVHDATATGPSIGLTADGFVDRTSNQISLQGAVAPMYGLNGLLGSIPVLGDVFVSKKGEGIFGITYTMRGDLDQPKISTNPLSVLAPGILRRIFEGKAPTGPSTSAAPSPARPQ
ncbi:MAG TPA: AsmA-like C-terminal domain-containing protein, partial [Rhizomicrobium sp.]